MANNQLLAADSFGSGSLATGWSALPGNVTSSIVSFKAQPPSTVAGGFQYWTGLTWPNDQGCEITTTTVNETGTITSMFLRIAPTGGTYSGYQVNLGNSAGTNKAIIYRIDAGVGTILSSTTITFNANDIWSFQAAGSVLCLYQNYNLIAYTTDSAYTSGSPGFGGSSTVNVTHSQVLSWRGYSGIQQDGIWAKQGIVLPVLAGDIANSGFGIQQPFILQDNNPIILTGNTSVYKMWFTSGGTVAGNIMSTNYAESIDGINWVRYGSNPVLAGFCNAAIVKNGSTYHLYAQASTQFGTGAIAHYTSSNGITWTQQSSAVISPGSAGQWDNTSFGMVTAPVFANGQWNMLYCGEVSGGGTPNMGLATSPDLAIWTKYAGNPVLTNSVGGAIAQVGNTFYLWSAVGPSSSMGNGTLDPAETARVQSIDLINWTNRVHSIHHSQFFESVNTNHGNATASTILNINGKAYLYYVGAPNDASAPQYYQHALAIASGSISTIVKSPEDAVIQLATDTFNRANGGLGANWSTPTGGTAQQIVSNNVESTVTNSYNAQYYNAASFSTDQYSEVTIGTLAASNYMGPIVRMQPGSNSGYVAQINGPTGSANTTAILLTMTNGVTTNIATNFGGVTTTPQIGDVFRLSVVGNVLSLYQNGTLVLQGNDVNNTYMTGQPGMFNYSATIGNSQISKWTGGNANVIENVNNMTQLYKTASNTTITGLGSMYTLVPASGATQIVYTGPTRIDKIIVTTAVAATTAVSLYDSSTGSTAGQPLFTIPPSTPQGTIYDVQIPVNSGITVSNTNSGVFTITLE